MQAVVTSHRGSSPRAGLGDGRTGLAGLRETLPSSRRPLPASTGPLVVLVLPEEKGSEPCGPGLRPRGREARP